jgi:pimeloyl-ACP methyl ester carboxylesterase
MTTVSDHNINYRGETIFARRWTVEDAPETPIVLLHESLGSTGMWKSFPEHLAIATGRTVISYDRPGYGKSTPRTEVPRLDFIEREATEVFPTVRKELGIGDYILLGHSVGGGIALRIAATDHRCIGVISESAQAFVEDRTLSGIRVAQERFADPAQLARLERWHGDRARWVVDAWTDTWLHPEFRSWRLRGLSSVQCPVLVIHGDSDEFGSQAFAETIAREVSGPTSIEITETGHIPHQQAEQDVLKIVTDFSGSCPR